MQAQKENSTARANVPLVTCSTPSLGDGAPGSWLCRATNPCDLAECRAELLLKAHKQRATAPRPAWARSGGNWHQSMAFRATVKMNSSSPQSARSAAAHVVTLQTKVRSNGNLAPKRWVRTLPRTSRKWPVWRRSAPSSHSIGKSEATHRRESGLPLRRHTAGNECVRAARRQPAVLSRRDW